MTIPAKYADIPAAFVSAAELAGVSVPLSEIGIEFCAEKPHRRSPLPPKTSAVYVFFLGGRCLKVGKAGAQSNARFSSQHYGTKAPSTLAKSILKDQSVVGASGLNEDNVGDWIVNNTIRINFFIPSKYGMFALSLLEAFVQCRLEPEYEGSVKTRLLS